MGATTIPSRPSHIRHVQVTAPLGAANARRCCVISCFICLERGLADNSVHAYRRDIETSSVSDIAKRIVKLR